MDRRSLLRADSEDDLLRQQEEFLSGGKAAPAATATRIARRAEEASPAAEAIGAKQDGTSGESSSAPIPAPWDPYGRDVVVMSDGCNVLTEDVAERPLLPVHLNTMPSPHHQIPSLTPFPQAAHRKESKFSLSRRAAGAKPPATTGSGFIPSSVASTRQTSVSADRQRTHTPHEPVAQRAGHHGNGGVASALGPGDSQTGPTDAAQIHNENLQVLSRMSAEEVSDALSTLQARLPAKTLAFLKARGAKKAGSSQETAKADKSPSHDTQGPQRVTHQSPQPPPTPVIRPPQPEHPQPAHSAAAAPAAHTTTRHTQSAAQGAEEGDGKLLADPRLFARLRWGLRGEVVGIQSRDEVITTDDVLMRDQIRKTAGSVPDGYTITETLILARSSHAPQRIAALRILRSLLLHARPTAQGTGSLGIPPAPRPIPVPTDMLGDLQDAAQAAPLWLQVYAYLVSDLGIASHLRLALDDTHTAVAAAAADAICALVSPGLQEATQWAAVECCPRLGWPAPVRATLTRPVAGATWAMCAATPAQVGGHTKGGGAGVQGEEEEDTPEDIACRDPVAGLMQMQILARLRYLMSTSSPESVMTSNAMQLLTALAEHSEAAAVECVRHPGLLDQLNSLLLAHAHTAQDATTHAQTSAEPSVETPNHDESREQAIAATQARVMGLLSTLCAVSAEAARAIVDSGLLSVAQGQLLVACHSLSGITTLTAHKRTIQLALSALEGLRMWRACVSHGVRAPLSFEAMHSALCPLMDPLTASSAAPDASGPSDSRQTMTALRWHLAREVYSLIDCLLCQALAAKDVGGDSQAPDAMIQPGTAAALLSADALSTWLAPQAIKTLATQLVTLSDMAPACGGGPDDWEEWHSTGVHSVLLVPTTTAALSCWSAALHAAATYWSTIPATTPVWGALTTLVSASGLLCAPTTTTLTHTATRADQPRQAPTTTDSTHTSTSSVQASVANTWQGACQGVATQLLASGSVQDTALGGAVAATCIQQAVLAQARDLSHSSLVLRPHQAVVCEFLAALLRLTDILSDLPSPPAPLTGFPTHTLARCLAQRVTVMVATHHLGSAHAMQPWQAAAVSVLQPTVRLFLAAADFSHRTAETASSNSSSSTAASSNQPTEQYADGYISESDALMAVLVASPPGAEAQCLTALRLLTAPESLQPVIAAGMQAMQRLSDTSPVLSMAAAGLSFQQQQDSLASQADSTVGSAAVGVAATVTSAAVPYPVPATPNVSTASMVLFDGWAATWLSMVAASNEGPAAPSQQPDNSQAAGQPDSGTAAAGAAEPRRVRRRVARVPVPRCQDIEGSRLPAPPTWHIREILAVPTQHSRPGPGRKVPQPGQAVNPVAAALLHACGLEALGSRSLDQCSGGAGAKLHAALHLAYLFNTQELCRGMAGAGKGNTSQAETPDMEASQWMDAAVRWPLATLTARWAAQALPPGWCGVRSAERLTQQFGSSSYGDPLYAQHVALLLAPSTAPAVLQTVWTSLVQDQALHLLPPVSLCIGPLQTQLRQRPCRDPTFINTLNHSLTTGELTKAEACQSVAYDIACVTLLAYVTNPWSSTDAAVHAAIASQGGEGADREQLQLRATMRAMSLARGLVQALTPPQLQRVVDCAVSYGLSSKAVGSVLVQACRGDLGLMTKLKAVLPHVQ